MILTGRLALGAGRVLLALLACYAVVTMPSLIARWGVSAAGAGLLGCWLALAALAWPIAGGALRGRMFWAVLVVVAAALRIGIVPLVLQHQPIGDPLIYRQLAASLLAGNGLIVHDAAMAIDFHALFPPAYPLLLAGIGATAGLSVMAICVSNILIDCLTAVLIVRLGERLGEGEAGRAAAWLFAIWPGFVLAAPFAQKESLMLLLVLAVVLALFGMRDRPREGWGDALALGLPSALLALTQPGLAVFPAALGLVLVDRVGWRRLASYGARAGLVAVAVMAPWWVRNGIVFHHFVPLTSTGGLSLWIGNNPQATGNWMPLPTMLHGLPELEASVRAGAMAVGWITSHPLDFVRLSATKLVRAGGIEQFALVRFEGLAPALLATVYSTLLPLLQITLLLLLAGAGAAIGPVRRMAGGPWLLRLLLGCALQIFGLGLWFEFGERHRYFAMPLLLLAVGYGLVAIRRMVDRPAGGAQFAAA